MLLELGILLAISASPTHGAITKHVLETLSTSDNPGKVFKDEINQIKNFDKNDWKRFKEEFKR